MYASISQLKEIVDLCYKAYQLSDNHSKETANIKKSVSTISNLITNPYGLVLYNGTAVLIAVATPSLFKDGLLIANLLFYADKNGIPLLKEYSSWAKGFPGSNEIYMSCSYGGYKGDRAEKLFEKLGLERVGSQFKVV